MYILMSTYLSIHHAKSAAFCARQANAANNNNQLFELDTFVMASIYFSVAFLEATANEIYADSKDDPNHWLTNIDEKNRLSLSNYPDFLKKNIWDKYSIITQQLGVKALENGCLLSESAKSLIQLRNNFTHYKADWLDSGSKELMRSGSSYKGDYWKHLNRLVFGKEGKNRAGHWKQKEYADWAVKTAISFVDSLFEKFGANSNIAHVRHELETVD